MAGPFDSNVLITGGAGFIGSNLAASYLSAGRPVTILDNLSRAGSERNLKWLRQSFGERLRFLDSDVRDFSAVQKAIQSAAIVFHFAAQVAVTTSLADPIEDYCINSGGALNVLEAARRCATRPCVVLTSTNKVYGSLSHLPMAEHPSRFEPIDAAVLRNGISESEPLCFHSPYGCSKGAADQYTLDYFRSYRLPTIVFRMSCICGPHQSGNEDQGWLAHFLIRAVADQPVTIFGTGKQVRDILYVGDLVRAFHLAERDHASLAGQAFNIGGGPKHSVSLLEVSDAIRTMTGNPLRLSFAKERVGDQSWYVSDTSKFARATGWSPSVSVPDSIKNIYNWLQSGSSPLSHREEKGGVMRFALINPLWSFERSIYFGCPAPHLPLEFGYAKALLEGAGHDVLLVDALLEGLAYDDIRDRIRRFRPDASVLTTAPSYLFWRCAPPELTSPLRLLEALRADLGELVVIGPHGSTTPSPTLRKLSASVVVIGEPEELLPRLDSDWAKIPSLCFEREGKVQKTGAPHQSNMAELPALSWDLGLVSRHKHHHHRFDCEPLGPGAEVEASRGCPYNCTFCAKENFRNKYRKRPLNTILSEIDGLLSQGVEYIYFVDEIFLPNEPLLKSLAERDLKVGVQTRIDLWNEGSIELLAKAGCVSIEAGVESITEEGRAYLDKKCKLSTDQLTDRLAFAKRLIPFVQANLISSPMDSEHDVELWRQSILSHGVWANKPVPLFPYPGSPEYSRRWGAPDDRAWERAHEYYLANGGAFSDIQEQNPLPLVQLEMASHERY